MAEEEHILHADAFAAGESMCTPKAITNTD